MNILGVSRRFAQVLLGLMAAATLAIVGLYAYTAYLEHAHANNLLKAEEFKREFDERLSPGALRSEVESYLATKPVEITRPWAGRDKKAEYRVTVTRERSPRWYCGSADVGVILYFSPEQRLVKT